MLILIIVIVIAITLFLFYKSNRCPVCKSKIIKIPQEYESRIINKKTNKRIIIKNIFIYTCLNSDCGHTWLPHNEERKLDILLKYHKLSQK